LIIIFENIWNIGHTSVGQHLTDFLSNDSWNIRLMQ